MRAKTRRARPSRLATGFKRLIVLALLAAAAVAAAGWWWLNQPLTLKPGPDGQATLELTIDPGTPTRGVAQAVVDAGVDTSPDLLLAWFRASGQASRIRAGSYALERGVTPRSLLDQLVRGRELMNTVTLVEGWTFQQMRDALARAEQLRPDTAALSPADLMAQLGRPGLHPEGRFFPDTYTYTKGSSDVAVLRRALHAMDKQLAAAWSLRDAATVLQTPEQALILASIVEKETGRPQDRTLVSGVFNNRLRIGMRLQTDPTVIYGLGSAFDGNLRKRDLQTDTAYNTYTRAGLPPTPIALPGKASLIAAVQPARTKALYFVARGDGTSAFSETLAEHNAAVNQYQRGGQ